MITLKGDIMKISRSKWDSFIKCPLCFYLLEKHKIKPPSTLNAIGTCCNKREKMTDKKTINILYP